MLIVRYSKQFVKSYKKLNEKDIIAFKNVLEKLINGEKLEKKYKDHKLKGEYLEYRECHIKPDLLLIYQIEEEILTLTCINIGSHSKLKLD